jgi:hypothetical protein
MNTMATDNTIYYIVGAIIVAHFVVGFGILIYKVMNAPKRKDEE